MCRTSGKRVEHPPRTWALREGSFSNFRPLPREEDPNRMQHHLNRMQHDLNRMQHNPNRVRTDLNRMQTDLNRAQNTEKSHRFHRFHRVKGSRGQGCQGVKGSILTPSLLTLPPFLCAFWNRGLVGSVESVGFFSVLRLLEPRACGICGICGIFQCFAPFGTEVVNSGLG